MIFITMALISASYLLFELIVTMLVMLIVVVRIIIVTVTVTIIIRMHVLFRRHRGDRVYAEKPTRLYAILCAERHREHAAECRRLAHRCGESDAGSSVRFCYIQVVLMLYWC